MQVVIKVKNTPSNPLLSEVKICNQRKLESFIAWFPNSDNLIKVEVEVVVLLLMPILALEELVLVKLLVMILVLTVEHLFQGGRLGEQRKTGVGGVHVQTYL